MRDWTAQTICALVYLFTTGALALKILGDLNGSLSLEMLLFLGSALSGAVVASAHLLDVARASRLSRPGYSNDEMLAYRLGDVEQRLANLETDGRMPDLEARLEFAERMLANRQRIAPRTPV